MQLPCRPPNAITNRHDTRTRSTEVVAALPEAAKLPARHALFQLALCACKMQQAVLVLAAGTTCLAARTHRLTVSNVPRWVPTRRLLGDGGWRADGDAWTAELTTRDACDVAASIRGVGLDGRKLLLEATPKLPRPAVRAARLEDARRRPVQKSNLSVRRCATGQPSHWLRTGDGARRARALRAGAPASTRRASGL